MADSINIRVSGKLKHFIMQQVGLDGLYESASEYIRDLIRKDYDLKEKTKWEWLSKQLEEGINAEEKEFEIFNPEDIINQAKKEQLQNEI
jgi:antitoxin ParD1/3/4